MCASQRSGLSTPSMRNFAGSTCLLRSLIRLSIIAATAGLSSPNATASSKPPGAAVTRTIFPETLRGPCGSNTSHLISVPIGKDSPETSETPLPLRSRPRP